MKKVFVPVIKAEEAAKVFLASVILEYEAERVSKCDAYRCEQIYNLYVNYRNIDDCTDDLNEMQVDAWNKLMNSCRKWLTKWYWWNLLDFSAQNLFDDKAEEMRKKIWNLAFNDDDKLFTCVFLER